LFLLSRVLSLRGNRDKKERAGKNHRLVD